MARSHARGDLGRLGSLRTRWGLGRSQQEPTGIQATGFVGQSSAGKRSRGPAKCRPIAISAVFGMETVHWGQAVETAVGGQAALTWNFRLTLARKCSEEFH